MTALTLVDSQHEFSWREFYIAPLLPKGWAEELVSFATSNAVSRILIPTSITSRETSVDIEIPILTVDGIRIREELPWLYDLYRGILRDIGQTCVEEPLSIADDVKYAINLNVQCGTSMRYECHIDSNPLQGLLYVTDHPPGAGGELVVANRTTAVGVNAIEDNCKRIYPESGKLVFFDARENPHFVAPLTDPLGLRVVVVMNFYTPSCPESARPKDLNRHLFGQN
jgi:hypothetical protein